MPPSSIKKLTPSSQLSPSPHISEKALSFATSCQTERFYTFLQSNHTFAPLGYYALPDETFTKSGSRSYNLKDTATDWQFHVRHLYDLCDGDFFQPVQDGLTEPFIVGDEEHNADVGMRALFGKRPQPMSLEELQKEDMVILAVSYGHGIQEQLSFQRLIQGVSAVQFFLEEGTRFVLWIDLVAHARYLERLRFVPHSKRRKVLSLIKGDCRHAREEKGESRNTEIAEVSWLKRGILPYQLFPALCLDNTASGRSLNDYQKSFWLNIEGVLSTLGSGMIMVGSELKQNAVDSWLFEHESSDSPCEIVHDGETQVAYRRGNMKDVVPALINLLQNVVKGGFDRTYVGSPKDKEDLLQMAQCFLHCKSSEEFGNLAYDPEDSNYEQLRRALTKGKASADLEKAMYMSGLSFHNVTPGRETFFPLQIEAIRRAHQRWKGEREWLPRHCVGYCVVQSHWQIRDVWLRLFSDLHQEVAALGIGIADYEKHDFAGDSRIHVKVVELKNSGKAKTCRVIKIFDVWDSRIPALVKEILQILEGKTMDFAGVARFVRNCGIDVPDLVNFEACTGSELQWK